jgi:hypothetical protein
VTRPDDLRLVAQLALETGDRTPAEQRALLRTCIALDDAYNANVDTNKAMWNDAGSTYAVQQRPFSRLVDEAIATYTGDGPPVTVAGLARYRKRQDDREACAAANAPPPPWVKPFAAFKPNVGLAYTWEPVILRGGRRIGRTVNETSGLRPGWFMTAVGWRDADGCHAWVAHDCATERVVTMLPFPTWRVLADRIDPSVQCDGCGLHTLVPLGEPEPLAPLVPGVGPEHGGEGE